MSYHISKYVEINESAHTHTHKYNKFNLAQFTSFFHLLRNITCSKDLITKSHSTAHNGHKHKKNWCTPHILLAELLLMKSLPLLKKRLCIRNIFPHSRSFPRKIWTWWIHLQKNKSHQITTFNSISLKFKAVTLNKS